MKSMNWWSYQGFEAFPYEGTVWREGIGGVYVFAALEGSCWDPVYVGRTEDFSGRLGNHDRWLEAESLGAIHVFVKEMNDESVRRKLEEQLIKEFNPPLNE